MDKTTEILLRHLDADFGVFPMAENRASPADVHRIEQRFGVKLPPEVSAHLCGEFPGIYIEVKEEIWPRPEGLTVGPFWTFLYGLHTYTPCADAPEWMSLEVTAASFQADTGLPAVPILKVIGDADIYCVTDEGTLSRFSHELNELEPIDVSFWELLEREVEELAGRKERKRSET